jgi:hypothetical protein
MHSAQLLEHRVNFIFTFTYVLCCQEKQKIKRNKITLSNFAIVLLSIDVPWANWNVGAAL